MDSNISAAISALFILVIVVGSRRGRSVADLDMVMESSSLPNVEFAAKASLGDLPCVEVGTFGRYDCKLLLHSKTAYYFFLPIPEAGQGSLNIYVLSEADVVGIHIVRGLDRNER